MPHPYAQAGWLSEAGVARIALALALHVYQRRRLILIIPGLGGRGHNVMELYLAYRASSLVLTRDVCCEALY